jgi:hypothetical protein
MEQACAILNYKHKAEREGLTGARFCTFQQLDKQIGYLLVPHPGRWYGDWKSTRANFKEYSSLSFWNMDFAISKKTSPLPFKGVFICFCQRDVFLMYYQNLILRRWDQALAIGISVWAW